MNLWRHENAPQLIKTETKDKSLLLRFAKREPWIILCQQQPGRARAPFVKRGKEVVMSKQQAISDRAEDRLEYQHVAAIKKPVELGVARYCGARRQGSAEIR